MLISLSGFINSGKDTVASILARDYDFIPLSCAAALKDAVSAIFCWDRELLEGKTIESREFRNRVDPWWANKLQIPHLTPRYVLQIFGTDVMRNFFPDIWILNVDKKIQMLDSRSVVITDARFSNEIELVKQKGGQVIWVKRIEPPWYPIALQASRGDTVSVAQMQHTYGIHESEWRWLQHDFDYTLNNTTTVADLEQQIHSFMERQNA